MSQQTVFILTTRCYRSGQKPVTECMIADLTDMLSMLHVDNHTHFVLVVVVKQGQVTSVRLGCQV